MTIKIPDPHKLDTDDDNFPIKINRRKSHQIKSQFNAGKAQPVSQHAVQCTQHFMFLDITQLG